MSKSDVKNGTIMRWAEERVEREVVGRVENEVEVLTTERVESEFRPVTITTLTIMEEVDPRIHNGFLLLDPSGLCFLVQPQSFNQLQSFNKLCL